MQRQGNVSLRNKQNAYALTKGPKYIAGSMPVGKTTSTLDIGVVVNPRWQ